MKTTRYYVLSKNDIGFRDVLEEKPVNMTGVDVVDLPYSYEEMYTIKGRGKKEYMAHRVALALAAKQISIDDITGVERYND